MPHSVELCPACGIGVDPEWDICPKCSQALSEEAIAQAGGPKPPQQNFASSLAWYYHLIPFLTSISAVIFADSLVESSGPLARTLIPPICFIAGGFVGLLILAEFAKINGEG